MCYPRLFLLVIPLLFSCSTDSIAFPDRYPPYDPESFTGRTLNAEAVNKPREAGRFTDKDLTIEWMAEDLDTGKIEIRFGNRLVTIIESEGHSVLLSKVYYWDIDRNGFPDVIIMLSSLSNGLEAYRSNVVILFQTEPGRFRELQYETLFFDLANIVDLDGDNRHEVIATDLVWVEGKDGKQHSVWLYLAYRIQSFDLVADQSFFPGFNRAVRFTHAPNDTPIKLTKEQMSRLIRKTPPVIKSKVLT